MFYYMYLFQVLSQTVANALPEVETVTRQFVLTFDKFFDLLNVRSPNEGKRRRKPNMEPYRKSDDPRLQVHTNYTFILLNNLLHMLSFCNMGLLQQCIVSNLLPMYTLCPISR